MQVLGLTPDLLAQREVVHVDIACDDLSSGYITPDEEVSCREAIPVSTQRSHALLTESYCSVSSGTTGLQEIPIKEDRSGPFV